MRVRFLSVFLALSYVLQTAAYSASPPPEPSESGWPREVTSEGRTFTIYQPQVEEWKDNELSERAAVSVQTSAQAEPDFGVIWIKGRTEVDKSKRQAALEDIQITNANFPSRKEQENDFRSVLQKTAPAVLRPINLDRLQASLAVTQAESKTAKRPLENIPPRIIYSPDPAILVLIDGKPVLRGTASPHLLRIVNTRSLMLLDQTSGKYYLNIGDTRWMVSSSLERGNWTVTKDTPPGLEQARQAATSAKQVATVRVPKEITPKVYVSTAPAELVQTSGSPQFQPVAETQLLYVKNTTKDLFLDTADQSYYLLLSGRWYRTRNLNGPWTYVSAKSLPADFTKIPENHPKGEVLASVAGTPEAQEAVISNQIPQTATIDRQQAGVAVGYDGNPEFRPIEGTPLFYAVNSPVPVIEVDPQSFYSVQNGVWFVATSPHGPWTVAARVPEVIYTIPPSSPLYYVTFVYVYGSTPRYVYVGYLPGYLGSYVTDDDVVVYGTGYWYPPWIGSVWYGYPVTFGFGFAWGFGYGWGFQVGFYSGYYGGPCAYPWWGPWREHPWVGAPVGPYGPHVGPHGWGPVRGPYVTYNVNRANVYHQWGRGAVVRTAPRTPYTAGAPVARNVPNNLYADRSGNVFRHGTNGWERYQGRTWQRVAPRTPEARVPRPNTGEMGRTERQAPPRELDQERMARELGEARARQYAARPPEAHHAPSGSMGGQAARGAPPAIHAPSAPPAAHAPSAPMGGAHMGGGGGGHFGGGGFGGGGHMGGGGGRGH